MLNILKNYLRKYNRNFTFEYLLKQELGYFNSSKKILDVGCGEGEFIGLDSKRIQGVDINKKSVKICKSKGFWVKKGSVLNMPYKADTFDGVHASHIIEHFEPKDAYKMLCEVSRVLKPNGILCISTPIMWDGFYNDFTHVKPYNPESITRYLCNNGSQKTFRDFPYSYRFVKLNWRYAFLPLPGRIGNVVSNFLYPYRVHTYRKNAYTLVLIKNK